ncbi:uncharacterized protein LOC135811376 isoform X1 [Sycon ciliatum]|uniref:uncharacterized protein LOC135811376 isoform X1 n=1 Tax=Sycon ciliatum TaxID=27933 RepID=UPI0031F6B8D2
MEKMTRTEHRLVVLLVFLSTVVTLSSGQRVVGADGSTHSPIQTGNSGTCMTQWLRHSFPAEQDVVLMKYERLLQAFETPVDEISVPVTNELLLSLVFGSEERSSNFSQCQNGQCQHPSPCQHGGTCVYASVDGNTPQLKQYKCQCRPRYAGRQCELAVSACRTHRPCQNGGHCHSRGPHAYECQCKPLFHGKNCEISDLANITSSLADLTLRLNSIETKSAQSASRTADTVSRVLKQIQLTLDRRLDEQASVVQSEIQAIRHEVMMNSLQHTGSCKEIQHRSNYTAPSGFYHIISGLTGGRNLIHGVYCDMDHYGGGWTRIAYINPTQEGSCPGNMRFQNLQVKLCTRRASSVGGCDGATFQSPIAEYSEVMGFVTGYRDNTLDAFHSAHYHNTPLNSWYMDGVSITHGSPMQHLWTYTGSFNEVDVAHCPCSPRAGAQTPPFVGSHYYCADHGHAWRRWTFTPAAHAWSNTSQCTAGGTCCDNTDMPWFHRQLDTSTSAPVQIRICANEGNSNENFGIDESAIFVK